jgi:peptide maturation system acyl carrier-related protein
MDKNMERLLKILKERFSMDLSGCWADIQDEHLLGSKLGMQAGDLIYLFFDVEREFGITIPTEEIISGRFNSLRNIAWMVQRELEADNTSICGMKVS